MPKMMAGYLIEGKRVWVEVDTDIETPIDGARKALLTYYHAKYPNESLEDFEILSITRVPAKSQD
jgi:hypothetical protein